MIQLIFCVINQEGVNHLTLANGTGVVELDHITLTAIKIIISEQCFDCSFIISLEGLF